MTIKIKEIAVIFIIGCSLCTVNLLYAGIGVEPTTIETVVTPNSNSKGVWTVVNDGADPIHVRVEAEDWLKRKTGISTVPVESWLTISPMEFDIEPQGIKEVEYTIAPPAEHKGELVAMIFFATTSQDAGTFAITARFGVSIYAAIENTILLACDVSNIKVNRNIVRREDGGSIDKGIIFNMTVENKGNAHLRPTGDIEIVRESAFKENVNIQRGFPVFPGAKLDYAIIWDKKDILPGKYEANIKLDYGKIFNRSEVIEKKVTFTVREDGQITF